MQTWKCRNPVCFVSMAVIGVTALLGRNADSVKSNYTLYGLRARSTIALLNYIRDSWPYISLTQEIKKNLMTKHRTLAVYTIIQDITNTVYTPPLNPIVCQYYKVNK